MDINSINKIRAGLLDPEVIEDMFGIELALYQKIILRRFVTNDRRNRQENEEIRRGI